MCLWGGFNAVNAPKHCIALAKRFHPHCWSTLPVSHLNCCAYNKSPVADLAGYPCIQCGLEAYNFGHCKHDKPWYGALRCCAQIPIASLPSQRCTLHPAHVGDRSPYWQSHWLSITVFQSGALRYRSGIPLAHKILLYKNISYSL